jgi:hypothetical protein
MWERGNNNDGREAIREKRGKETKTRKGIKEKEKKKNFVHLHL